MNWSRIDYIAEGGYVNGFNPLKGYEIGAVIQVADDCLFLRMHENLFQSTVCRMSTILLGRPPLAVHVHLVRMP